MSIDAISKQPLVMVKVSSLFNELSQLVNRHFHSMRRNLRLAEIHLDDDAMPVFIVCNAIAGIHKASQNSGNEAVY